MAYEIATTPCAPYWTNVFQGPRGETHMEPCRNRDDAINDLFYELVPANAEYQHTVACLGDGSPLLCIDLRPDVEEKRRGIQEEHEHIQQEKWAGAL